MPVSIEPGKTLHVFTFSSIIIVTYLAPWVGLVTILNIHIIPTIHPPPLVTMPDTGIVGQICLEDALAVNNSQRDINLRMSPCRNCKYSNKPLNEF